MIPLDPSPAVLTLPANVACTTMDGAPWWAWGVEHDDGTIEIRTGLCAAMLGAVEGRVSRDAADGVFILGHEEAHAAGVTDERLADCAGWVNFARDAAGLGIPYRIMVPLKALETVRGKECGT